MGLRSSDDAAGRPPLDPRDAEIERLKREVAVLRERESASRAEAQDARKHFTDLTAVSKRFAYSMHATVEEREQQRRRLAAQYAISQVLAEARDLDEAAPKVYEILGERLGWQAGALWKVDEDSSPPVLRRAGHWRSGGSPSGALEEESESMVFRRGEGLPGRVWERCEPVWVEDIRVDGKMLRKAAVDEDGLRGALAFPIVDGGPVGVFELFRREVLPPDEDLMRTAGLVGGQISQFLERRHAEEERDLALARERATGILESINDAFFTLDEERRFTYVNNKAEGLWGKAREELLGRNIWEAFPETVGSEPYRAVEQGLREGEAATFEAVSSVMGIWISGHVYPSPDGVSVLFHSIEERKQAEGALRRSEERFRAVVQNTSDIITILEVDGTIRYESPSIERVLGYGTDELVGKSAFEYVHPDDLEKGKSALAEAAKSGSSTNVELRFARKDGSWCHLDLVGSLVHTPGVHGIVVNSRDITERKRAEEALRESEERLQRAVAIETVGVIFFKSGGEIFEANDAFLRMSGYDREDLASGLMRWDTMTPPEHMARSLEAIEEFESTGRTTPYEKQYLRKDGSRWWGLFAATRLDEGEGVEYIVDITEAKRAEEALRDSEERYRSLAEATSSIVWTGDRNGAVVEEIPDWEEFTGQTYREYRGFGWLDALHPEDRPPENLWEEFSSSDPSPMEEEYRLKHRSGEYRRIVLRGVPILDGGDTPREWVGTIFDVEDSRRAEEEREELRREAEEERARLETILQQMPGGIFFADPSGRFVLANEGAARIYGQEIGSVEECGRHSLSYPEGKEIPREDWPLTRALRGEAVTDMEYYAVRPDGTRRVVRTNAAPVLDGEGNVVAAVKASEDITGRKEAERERDRSREREREARDAAEAAERRLAFYAGAREERQLISRELHDRVAHSIAVVRQNLELYEVLRDRNPEAATKKMELAKEEAKVTLKSTRDLSMMLRRSEAEDGIAQALAGLEETTVPMGVCYEYTVNGDESLVPPHVSNQVFLILREAVRNAVNHSGCGRVAVRLEVTEGRVIGTVEDDGRGFDPDEARAGGGLRSMEERASLVGGEFRLRSTPGNGTRAEIHVPLKGAEA